MEVNFCRSILTLGLFISFVCLCYTCFLSCCRRNKGYLYCRCLCSIYLRCYCVDGGQRSAQSSEYHHPVFSAFFSAIILCFCSRQPVATAIIVSTRQHHTTKPKYHAAGLLYMVLPRPGCVIPYGNPLIRLSLLKRRLKNRAGGKVSFSCYFDSLHSDNFQGRSHSLRVFFFCVQNEHSQFATLVITHSNVVDIMVLD